jgi:hypothetical protein
MSPQHRFPWGLSASSRPSLRRPGGRLNWLFELLCVLLVLQPPPGEAMLRIFLFLAKKRQFPHGLLRAVPPSPPNRWLGLPPEHSAQLARLSTDQTRLPTAQIRFPTAQIRLPTAQTRLPTAQIRFRTAQIRYAIHVPATGDLR